jgi:hypothetical protein
MMQTSGDSDVRHSLLNVATVSIVILSLGRWLPGKGGC